jgi:CBS domain containing-hemolysin-like protein
MNEVEQFFAGLGSVGTVVALEFGAFLYNTVFNLLPTIPQNSATNNSIMANLSLFAGLFILLNLAQSFIVGSFAPKPYVIGFLLGDGVFVYAFYIYVMNLIPSVVWGMAVSFLIVIGCFILRLHFEKPQRYDPWNN